MYQYGFKDNNHGPGYGKGLKPYFRSPARRGLRCAAGADAGPGRVSAVAVGRSAAVQAGCRSPGRWRCRALGWSLPGGGGAP